MYSTQPGSSQRPAVAFDAATDASGLRKAMKGFGTDEAALINILCRRTNSQRQQIAHAFKCSFGRDLIKDLKSELSGKVELVMVNLLIPPVDFLAQQLHEAMEGMGTKEHVLIEVLCTMPSNAEIQAVAQAYQKNYGKSLEKRVCSETGSDFRCVLVAILQAGRDESNYVDHNKASMQAQALYKAGEKMLGTDEEAFISILATQSVAQLRAVFTVYESSYKKSFIDVVKSETSGDYGKALIAITKSALNRHTYFAELLHKSMQGAGTNDGDLIRLLISRSEIDLPLIQQEYLKFYGKTLAKDISGDCSGDYKKALLAIAENFI